MWGAGGDGERSAPLCEHPPRPTPALRTQGLDLAPSVYCPCQAPLWPHLHTHVSGHSGICVSPRPPEGHCVGQTWPVGPDESPFLRMGLGVLLTGWLCWSLVALGSESSFRGCQETPNCLVFFSSVAFFLPTDFCKLCPVFLPVMTTPQSGFWLFACTGLPASQSLLTEA